MVIKAVDEDKREISGIASTPEPDRVDDIVEPDGAIYKLPIPLLWQHDSLQPIGEVFYAKRTKDGIEIRARLVKLDAPSQLAARLEEAWASIKSGLVKGLSIGFKPKEYAFLDNGGIRYLSWEWFELSAVTIPANADASITSIKSLDQQTLLASSGATEAKPVKAPLAAVVAKTQQPVKHTPLKKEKAMTPTEQLKNFKATLATKKEARAALLEKAGTAGETMNAEDQTAFDTLTDEINEVQKHLDRVQLIVDDELKTAKPATAKAGEGEAEAKRVRTEPTVRAAVVEAKGLGFARLAMSMHASKGDAHGAMAFAEKAFPNDARLANVLKAAVSAGGTISPTWAGNLVDYQNLSSEFVEFLRPKTIIGQFGVNGVPELRRVPFNVQIPGKTASGTAAWVGEGYAKPVTSSAYDARTLKWAKVAAISVITEELARFSDPSIQTLVRDDLAEAVIERIDTDFINPLKAAGTGASLSPASITNGVTAIVATGDPECDIENLWAVADDNNLPISSAVYITDVRTARQLAGRKDALGNKVFPDVTLTGGRIGGVPLIVSNYAPRDSGGSILVLAFASEIYLADDSIVTIDTSREASILMDNAASASMNSLTPTGSTLVSMFQTNSIAIRAERYINWAKRRTFAVAYLENVDWSACT